MKQKRTLSFLLATIVLVLLAGCLFSCGDTEDGTYAVSLPTDVTGGSVTASAQKVTPGESLTLTVSCRAGYVLSSLQVNGKEMSADLVDGTLKIVPDGAVAVEVVFRAVEYEIIYMDGETRITSLTPATYTVEDTVILPTPHKEGFGFLGWYTVSSLGGIENTRIPAGSTGTKTFYAKWEAGRVTVTGDLLSETVVVNGREEPLYTSDLTKAQILFTNSEAETTSVSVREDGTYSAALLPGSYTVTFTHPYFVCSNPRALTVTSAGVTADTASGTHLLLDTPKLTGDFSATLKGWTQSDDSGYWQVDGQTAQAIDPKGVNLFFEGQLSDRYLLEARISHLTPRNADTGKDKKAGLMVAAYGSGSRDWLVLDQDNQLVHIWNSGSWNATESTAISTLDLTGEGGNLLTVVRDSSRLFVFVDGCYMGCMELSTADAAGFGFGILGGTATFSDYRYTYNEAIIRERLACDLSVPTEVDHATLSVTPNEQIQLGDVLTFTVTPEQDYAITSFTVNGRNLMGELTEEDGVCTLHYTVDSPTVIVRLSVDATGAEITTGTDPNPGDYGPFIPFRVGASDAEQKTE